ncbi:MAG: serine protease [Desulfobacteraceae bacterium]|nr:MAG: serine protease [Desulfobacteraceae bacterium]
MAPVLKTRPVFSALRILMLHCLVLAGSAGFLNAFAQSAPDPETAASETTVYIISVSGEVDPGMAAFVERAVQAVSGNPDALVVVKIDTFGGRVDSALEIVDSLLKIPGNRSIAFVEKKAISAGALIALACGDLVMRPAATIGDCAPISYSQEGVEMLGEKFQSPIRAKFRALAKRNGYPEKLAEAMVSSEKEVFSVEIDGQRRLMDSSDYKDLTDAQKKKITAKKTVVEKGELLTMEAEEAVELGFSKFTAPNVEDMLRQMEVKNYMLIPIDENWSETMARVIGRIAPILMMIGLAGLYLEMKAPGFGLPGIVGISCLAIVFLGQYMAGLADYTEFLIILSGIVLMGIEVFVLPGFGIAGFAAIACIAVGMVLTFQDFVIPDPSIPWEAEILAHNVTVVIISYIGAFLGALLFLRYVLPRFSVGQQGPFLTTDLHQAHANSSETAKVRAGDRGMAMSSLRPSGKAIIHDDLFDVVTEGEFMEKGAPIVVYAVKGNRIVVSRGSQ